MNMDNISLWLFDLDNTLYPPKIKLLDQIECLMNKFTVDKLGYEKKEAQIVNRQAFEEYGSTLIGLMSSYEIDPIDFLSYTHNIDYSQVKEDTILCQLIKKLPGRKVILTNAPKFHAEKVLKRLKCSEAFSKIYGISDVNYISKKNKENYEYVINQENISAESCCVFDDLACNLRAPADLGSKTVWLRNSGDINDRDLTISDKDHHEIYDLKNFLSSIN